MKRFFAVILVLALCGGLFGCGGNSGGYDSAEQGYSEEPQTEPTTTEPPTTAAPLNLNLKKYSGICRVRDYELCVTMEVGQWVRMDDSAKLDAMWQAVGGAGSFPWNTQSGTIDTYGDYGIDGRLTWNSADMACFFGKLTVTNATPGFSITSTSNVYIPDDLYYHRNRNPGDKNSCFSLLSAASLNGNVVLDMDYAGAEHLDLFHRTARKMTSNSSGPIPFVVGITCKPSPDRPARLNDFIENIQWTPENIKDAAFTVSKSW